MDLSTRFNQKVLSDVVLHLMPTLGDNTSGDPDSRSRGPSSEEDLPSERSFYLHKIILFQSPYFEKLYEWLSDAASAVPAASRAGSPGGGTTLNTSPSSEAEPPRHGISWYSWLSHLAHRYLYPHQPLLARMDQSAAQAAGGACLGQTELLVPASSARTELVEHVEECDMEAAELLLKCLYKAELPQEAQSNGQLLLQVYRLEDKYGVPAACMELVLAALAAFQANDIDLALLLHFYSLPAQLSEALAVQKVNAACKQRLVELFRNVPAVITDIGQRRQFCALPYAAVLAWLHCDNLEVHSESCVLLLLTAWVNSKEHPACSPGQLQRLAHNVRVKHLSATYLHGVLPELEWFQYSCSEDIKLLRALHVQQDIVGSLCRNWEGPASWIADQRKGTAMPESAVITWDLGPHELGELGVADADKLYSPTSAYLNGVFFRVLAVGKEEAAAEGVEAEHVTLGMYLAVNDVKMIEILGFWDCSLIPCLFKAELWAAGELRFDVDVVGLYKYYGSTDILLHSGTTIAELIAPSLIEGHLNLQAVISFPGPYYWMGGRGLRGPDWLGVPELVRV